MKYDPVLKTLVDDDYRLEDHLDFKKQHADINYQKLHAQLNEINNDNIHAILTAQEAAYFYRRYAHLTLINRGKRPCLAVPILFHRLPETSQKPCL